MEKKEHTEIQEKVNAILDFYFNGEHTSSLDRKIQDWLTDGRDRQEKEEALKRQWDRQVRETKPDRETYAALAAIRSRRERSQYLHERLAGHSGSGTLVWIRYFRECGSDYRSRA